MKTRKMRALLCSVMLIAVCGAYALDYEMNTIEVTGYGVVNVPVDTVILRFSVETFSDVVARAVSENADCTARLAAALAAHNVASSEIFSGMQYRIYRDYERSEKQKKDVFAVHNTVVVKTEKTQIAGTLVDAAVQISNVLISDIDFVAADTSAASAEAQRIASSDAKKTAVRIAADNGRTVGAAVYITTDGPSLMPQKRNAAMLMETAAGYDGAAPTVFCSDTIQVSATVRIVYELK